MKPGCSPRPSDLTGNDKLSRVYGAQESVEDVLATWDTTSPGDCDKDSLEDALTTAAETIREVGEEYRESAEAINETAEGSPIAEECEEKADGLESWADEIESAASDLDECPDAEDCEECKGEGTVETKATKGQEEPGVLDCSECDGTGHANHEERTTWAEAAQSTAEDAMSECPL
jgi:hypothetical protein